MGRHARDRGERGQASVEWIGLVVLVALVLGGAVAAGFRPPLTGIARSLGGAIACAVRLGDCSSDPELVVVYGPELARLVRAYAPEIRYEAGMTALPVDFRSCRGPACGNGPASGAVSESDTGQAATAFVRLIDCREALPGRGGSGSRPGGDALAAASATKGADCSGDRAGHVYIQYWLFYEDSTSLRALPGEVGHHEDDWEGYQVRIGSGQPQARATSHHGYNHAGGPGSWPSDLGVVGRAGWGEELGHLYVSGGSHAGHVTEWNDEVLRAARNERTRWHPALARLRSTRHGPRWTSADRLRLVPIESLGPTDRATPFAVNPPWEKAVYRDPEWEGT